MAKPNYQFDKKQRDLAKKKKQEDKRLKKQGKDDEAPSTDDTTALKVADN